MRNPFSLKTSTYTHTITPDSFQIYVAVSVSVLTPATLNSLGATVFSAAKVSIKLSLTNTHTHMHALAEMNAFQRV